MAATVYDIHHRYRKSVAGDAAKETIQRNIQCGSSRSAARDRYGQDRICTKLGLILCAVCRDHRRIYCINVRRIHTGDRCIDRSIDVLYCFLYALAKVSALVAIAQLQCFKFSSRCSARRHASSYSAVYQIYLRLHGRIAAGVHNFSSNDLLNLQVIHVHSPFVYLLSPAYAEGITNTCSPDRPAGAGRPSTAGGSAVDRPLHPRVSSNGSAGALKSLIHAIVRFY